MRSAAKGVWVFLGYVATVQSKRDAPHPWAVCVYCASGPAHPELLALAAEVGEAIADRGWTLVWGGGNVSAMGALATAARARGGWTVGVIPKALVRREVADHDADEFITLPGGIGTLEELFEAWTGGYLGMHDKPVVMLDPGGHFDGLRAWLRGLLDSGYVSQAAMDTLVVVDDVDAAIAACTPR